MDQQVAVVGCGYWGKNLVRNFAQLNALGLICDADTRALQAQSSLYAHVSTATRFEDILESSSIQAVVLATPAVLHHSQVKAALLHGKDVFVEKPLALRYREGVELVELARDRRAVLMVGHVLEYHPAVALLKEIVHGGDLGEIRYIYSNRLNLGKVRQEENILWSFAPHDISVITSLLEKEPLAVSAAGGAYLQKDIADVTVSTMQFDDGVRAHIFVSWLHPYKDQRLVVIGDRKMAVFDDAATEGKLKIFDKGIEWRDGQPVPRQTSESQLFFDPTEPLRRECEHFLACVADRSRPLTDGANALRVLKVLQASQMSLEQDGAPVPITAVETKAAA
jgi:UDP-2-acetamido-3-amino-2,3-dideoxy-glucuronate N-acetyltransferase